MPLSWILGLPLLGVAIAWQPLWTPALLLYVAVSGALSSAVNAKRALLALAVYTPFETLVLNGVPEPYYMAARFAPQALLFGCTAGVMLRRLWDGRPLWRRNPIDAPLLAFLAASGASFLINRPPLTAALMAYQPFLRFILIAYGLALLVEFDAREAMRLTRALFAVAAAVSCIGIAQSLFPDALNPPLVPHRGEHGDYVIGGFSQPAAYETGYQVFATLGRYNVCGLYLAFFFVLSLPFWVAYPRFRGQLCALYAVLLPCVYLTSARVAFLFVGAGVLTLLALHGRWRYAVALPAGAAVLALLALPSARFVGYEEATTLERMLEVFDPFYLAVASRFGRLYFILRFPLELFSMGTLVVLLGFGPGTLDWRSLERYGLAPLDALNVPPETARGISDVNWSYILGQAGWVALAAVLWMCWRLGCAGWRVRREHPSLPVRCLAEGFVAVLVAHCAAAFFAPVWEWRPTSLYLWLYAGLVVSFRLGLPPAEAPR
jgi:hypothetical protein